MNQVADILDLAAQAIEQNVDAVLATVVHTEGSAYRQPGAMMLICADGRSVGMISGGCLEPHIIKRAFWLTRNGANVQVYQTGEDTTYRESEDNNADLVGQEEDGFLDSELNFGLGCNGRVHVLFERLATAMSMLDVIRQVRTTQRPVTIATLVRSDSAKNKENELQIGIRLYLDEYVKTEPLSKTKQLAHLYLDPSMSVDANTVIDNTLLNVVEKLSNHQFTKKNAEYVIVSDDLEKNAPDNEDQHKSQKLMSKSGQTEWLFQRICPQIRLLICGAGNDVIPLVTMAKLQDWHVTVIDSRPQYATPLRFPQADSVKYVALEDIETLLKLSAGAAIAVMSHSLTQDRERLAVLLAHSAQYRYLGQLGPGYRTERLIKEIKASSLKPRMLEEGIANLHYPIGYKLGGDGPEALALSIMAQISAVIHGQTSQASLQDDQCNLPTSKQSGFNNYTNDYAYD